MQACIPHPSALDIDRDEPILRVVCVSPNRGQELHVSGLADGRYDFEVGEETTRRQKSCHFRKQSTFAVILQMMDRKAGDDEVKRPTQVVERACKVSFE